MGYTLFAYLVNIERLVTIFGSDDTELAASLTESYLHEPGEYTPFEVDDSAARISIEQAISDIVAGRITAPEESEQYGYALEYVCKFLGEELPNEQFDGINSGIFNVFDAIPTVKRLMVGGQSYPIPIPPIRYLPNIAFITFSEACQELPGLEVDWDAIPDVQQEYAHKVIQQYTHWLSRSVETGDGIVTFYS